MGRKAVPELLRADGWDVVTLAEHYGVPADERVADEVWLRLAGQRRWPVLMKDDRIRYRPAERAALLEHSVRAFCLTSGNLKSAEMAQLFISQRDQIWAHAGGEDAVLYAVSRSGLRQISLMY